MVGVLVAIAGLVRLGWIADLLSRPVLTGFLAGIACTSCSRRRPPRSACPRSSGRATSGSPSPARPAPINWTAAVIALGVFAVTFAAEKLSPRIPGALIGLAGATLAAAALGLGRRACRCWARSRRPADPRRCPGCTLESLVPLVGLAGVVALVVMVQTAATTRSVQRRRERSGRRPGLPRRRRGGPNRRHLRPFPVNASPPRTAAVSEAGGRSQIGGLAAAATCCCWRRSAAACWPRRRPPRWQACSSSSPSASSTPATSCTWPAAPRPSWRWRC